MQTVGRTPKLNNLLTVQK